MAPFFDIPYQAAPHAKWQTELSCTLSPVDAAAWADLLEIAKQTPASDPCVRIKPRPPGEQWAIYWKIRDAESRAMLAHPNPGEWVATLALTEAHLEVVIDKLRRAESFRLDGAGNLARMSNFHVVIEVK
ncbi:MAG: hypothetical protein AB7P04_00250 [Bacteriovoracia bacterium]